MTETDVVRAFLGALESTDLDAALALCADHVTYQNVPLPPARGRDAVARQLRIMEKYATGFEVEMKNIAANGSVVLTERIDVLSRGGWSAEFWVCGTFEVHDGQITLWRDYFDWTTFLGASVKGAGRATLGALSKRLGR